MDIKLLKTDILSNNIPNFLIFESDEQALSKQYIEYIANTIGKDYKFYNSADAALYDISVNIKEDYLYVIYDDKNVKLKERYVESLKASGKNIIVYYNSIDKDDFYKRNIANLVVFEKLDEYTMLSYAKKLCKDNKCSIDIEKLQELVKACNYDLGILINELNKIFILDQENSNVLVNYMLQSNFPDYREINLYEFINRVLNKDKTVLNDFQKLSNSSLSTILCLYNTARQRLLKTKNEFYGKLMAECFDVYDKVVNGSMSGELALKYLLYILFV